MTHHPIPAPAAPGRILTTACSLITAWACCTTSAARGDTPPPTATTAPVLTLANGGVVLGTLVDTARPRAITWQSDQFVSPFDFRIDEVQSVRFPGAGKPAIAAGSFGLELTGGDRLFGSVVGLDEKAVELDVAKLGHVRVDRARIQRIFRWRDGADVIYHGPNGLDGWREFTPPKAPQKASSAPVPNFNIAINGNVRGGPAPPPKPAPPVLTGPGWVDDGGPLQATRDAVTIQAEVGLPTRAAIEVELSWERTPNFLLALGVGEAEKTVQQAFRLEVWDGQIVALRETDKEADLAPLMPVGAGPGRAWFQLYLDQEAGRLLVFSEAGESLADLKLGGGAGPGLPGIRLSNIQGDLRLERLRVVRWDGQTTQAARANEPHLVRTDRSIVRGPVDQFDPNTREFIVGRGASATRVAADQVEHVEFFPPEAEVRPAIRVVYGDGTRVAGNWVGVEGRQLFLTVPGITGVVRLPQEGLRSLNPDRPASPPRSADDGTGTLELNGVRLLGRLVNSDGRPGAGCLAWLPLASETASNLKPGTSGKILFLKPIVSQPAPQNPAVASQRVPAPRKPRLAVQATPATGPLSLYLRTGDIVPVEVAKIDEDGLWFQSSLSDNHFVPNARIKAVELAADEPQVIRVSKAKLDRLLTLPRMQKDSPPTHLIRSRNGDLLRGRVVAMDDKTLRVEMRLEAKEVPRDRVSRLIWLHADETDPAKKPAGAPEGASTTRVQAVRSDGIRLTFIAEGMNEGVLVGKSDVLGVCKVRLQDLDQLLLGESVEREATQLAYQNFKLHNALEPKSAAADAGDSPDGGAAGTESALVGKAAPDFQLDLLGGAKFHLADLKGKVVVLDFWATWCGPCLQAMPQIDRATRAFADKDVQLIAVNLQEAPAKITAMLERQKLTPTVALDKTGAVAEKYGATAIPQTVVIDREGKITRLFIGGGPHLEDQLREALEQALAPAKKP